MDKFYTEAGELLSHEVEISGVFPRRVVTSVFTYQNGEARYDGEHWTFKLNK